MQLPSKEKGQEMADENQHCLREQHNNEMQLRLFNCSDLLFISLRHDRTSQIEQKTWGFHAVFQQV